MFQYKSAYPFLVAYLKKFRSKFFFFFFFFKVVFITEKLYTHLSISKCKPIIVIKKKRKSEMILLDLTLEVANVVSDVAV